MDPCSSFISISALSLLPARLLGLLKRAIYPIYTDILPNHSLSPVYLHITPRRHQSFQHWLYFDLSEKDQGIICGRKLEEDCIKVNCSRHLRLT
ncbi:hypothetical protein BJ166DRAFT_203623 [Pestalotiopsis sp. NC0098]|nr:hypothetical protein BJ166DRAFT_203623 [Pestalotiopsis sp. NC0098]